jgi:hypothetical protein
MEDFGFEQVLIAPPSPPQSQTRTARVCETDPATVERKSVRDAWVEKVGHAIRKGRDTIEQENGHVIERCAVSGASGKGTGPGHETSVMSCCGREAACKQLFVLQRGWDLRRQGGGEERNERTGDRRAHSSEERGGAAGRRVGESREWSGQVGESGTDRSSASCRRTQRS